MSKKKKSLLRSRPGERPLAVRIFAIVVILMLIVALLVTMLPAFVYAEGEDRNYTGDRDGIPLVVDQADILTDEEEAELSAGLQKFRLEQDFDIVVLTVESLEGKGVVDYADDYYDYKGYGGGPERDGAIILVSTENRDWTMTTSGYGITAITDYGLDLMEEEILPQLSAGNYAGAFRSFGDKCAYYVREAKAGNIIDEYIYDDTDGPSGEKPRLPMAANAGAAGVIGVIISLITNGRNKAKLKSVRYKTQAKEYVRKDSLRLRENRDRFLYKTVSRAPIRDDDDDDGPGHFRGSTIHMSSSGRIHGGGRPGKF